MISAHIVTLSTTAEKIIDSAKATAAIPITVTLTAGSADDIYIGGPGVDSTDGYPIGSNTLTLIIGPGDDLWAVAGTGTPTINVLQTRAGVQASD